MTRHGTARFSFYKRTFALCLQDNCANANVLLCYKLYSKREPSSLKKNENEVAVFELINESDILWFY